MITRNFVLVLGIVYLAIGLLGFVPGTHPPRAGMPDLAVDAGYGYLLGLFPINVLHNIVHLLVGAAGVVASRRLARARAFSFSLAVFYGLLTAAGMLPGTQTLGGLVPLFGLDIALHAGTAALAFIIAVANPDRGLDSRLRPGTR